MEYRQALPVGSLLESDYRIQSVLGQGGFGLTYKADELRLHNQVAIKEYFPGDLALRERGSTVVARSARDEDVFEWGRAKFLEEARTLARFRHPNIVRVARLFEANNTAYMVLDFEMGPNLAQWRAALGRAPTEAEIDTIAFKLLGAVGAVHDAGLLHRDIKPANIIMRDGAEPVLIDFGAARQALSAQSRTVHAIVTPGYSPKEQYAVDLDRQGAWSDIYALGATLYFLVTGKAPPDALSRDLGDTMTMEGPATASYRAGLIAAIERAMSVRAQDRPQSVTELRAMLAGAAVTVPGNPTSPAVRPRPAERDGGSRAVSGALDAASRLSSKRPTIDDVPVHPDVPGESDARGSGLVAAAVVAGVLVLGGLWYWINIAAPARDDAAWSRALTADTADSYEQYAREQPSGRHLTEAQSKRRVLAEQRTRVEPASRQEQAAAEAKPNAGPAQQAGPTQQVGPAPPTTQPPVQTTPPQTTRPTFTPAPPQSTQQKQANLPPQGQSPGPAASTLPPRETMPAPISAADLATLARTVPAANLRLSVLLYTIRDVRGFSDQQRDFVSTLSQLSGGRLVASPLTGTDNVGRGKIFERLKAEKNLIAWHAPLLEGSQHGEFSILAGAVPFGLQPADHVRWMREEGARLLEQSYALYGNPIRAIPCGIAGGAGGWFRREIRSPADFNGLKITGGRIMGAAARALGAVPVTLRNAREIAAAYSANRIDAVMGVTPLLDTFAGSRRLAPVYHYPGVHNPSYMFDLLIGAETWAAFAEPQRRLIDEACRRNIDRWATVFPSSQNDALNQIRALRVTVRPFTAPVREALQKAVDVELASEAAKNANFKTILDSYNRFRR